MGHVQNMNDWAGFLDSETIPANQKYFVFLKWNEGEEVHSCRFPVRARTSEEAIEAVKAYSDWPHQGTNHKWQSVLVSQVAKSQLDYVRNPLRGEISYLCEICNEDVTKEMGGRPHIH